MNFLVIGSGAREHIIAQKLFDAGVESLSTSSSVCETILIFNSSGTFPLGLSKSAC